MKKKQIIITSVIVIILGLICFIYVYNIEKINKNIKINKENQTFLTKTVYNQLIDYKLTANGRVCEPPIHTVNFEVEGELINGELLLETGIEFKKNQLLYRINNEEAFSLLSEKKIELALLLKSLIPQIEAKFQNEKEKWTLFQDEIKSIKRLPELPTIITPDERVFLIEKGFMQAYVKVGMQEIQMEKYFYLAPFDGKCIQSNIKSGEIIAAGASVASISENTDLMAKVNIPENSLDIYKQQKHVHFVNKNGSIIGNGKLIQITRKKKRTPKVEALYTVQTKTKNLFQSGKPLRIITNHTTPDKSVAIPYSLINGNTVKILVDNKPVSKTVTIIAKTPTHYFIVGLMDGDKIILE